MREASQIFTAPFTPADVHSETSHRYSDSVTAHTYMDMDSVEYRLQCREYNRRRVSTAKDGDSEANSRVSGSSGKGGRAESSLTFKRLMSQAVPR